MERSLSSVLAAARAARAMCSAPGSSAWAATESTASSGARRARSKSVTTGMSAGPSTHGCSRQRPRPRSIGRAHQRPTSRSRAMITRVTGQASRVRRPATYSGQVRRLRGSSSTCTSTTSASSGRAGVPPSASTASARCSAKLRSANSAAVTCTGRASSSGSPCRSRVGTSSGALRTSWTRASWESLGIGGATVARRRGRCTRRVRPGPRGMS